MLSVENQYFLEVPCLSNLDQTSLSQIEFAAEGSQIEYTDLAQSYIALTMKIVKADGTPLTATDKVIFYLLPGI